MPESKIVLPLKRFLLIKDCPAAWKGYNLYLFRDEIVTFYVGQSQLAFARVWEHLLGGLRPLASRFELVGDVRGSGLFLGVELVRDRVTLEPAADEATFVVNRMRSRGVLVGADGPFHNVIKIRGPMPLTLGDADRIVDALTRSLEEWPR